MRTTLLLLLTVVLIGGGFFVYFKRQKETPRLAQSDPVAPLNVDADAGTIGSGGAGPGERPWSKVFDKVGRLASRFNAATYTPRGESHVYVKKPVAEFFQYPHPKAGEAQRVERIRVEGVDGDVEIHNTPQASPNARGGFDKGPGGPPKRGRLNDVTIYVFPDVDRPYSLVMRTRDVVFDNESFEISTEGYTDPATGAAVAADQVPVTVAGDYEFHGRGLRMRWNDVEGRLESLEIAHGDYLEIKNPSALKTTKTPAPAATADAGAIFPRLAAPAPAASPDGTPVMLAAHATRLTAGPTSSAPRKAARGHDDAKGKKGPQPPYRAIFHDNVRVSQGQRDVMEKLMVTADLMNVDFLGGQSKGDSPTTAPTSHPTSRPVAAVAGPISPPPAADLPTTGPTSVALAGPGATTAPSTVPASRTAEEPVIVRWSGKLDILPLDQPENAPNPPLKPGESIVRFVGSTAPVYATRDLNTIRCAALAYFTGDGSVAMRNSQAFPQVMLSQEPHVGGATRPGAPDAPATTQPSNSLKDATVVTESVDFSGTDHIAVLGGRSWLRADMKDQNGRPGDRLEARWNKSAHLYFNRPANAAEPMSIRLAKLEGDAYVEHPQLTLKSQMLDLGFAADGAPTTSPANASTSQPAGEGAMASARHSHRAADSGAAQTRPAGPSSQPQLRTVLATTGVDCRMKDAAGKVQTVLCERLALSTAPAADGGVFPRVVDADSGPAGTVRTYDGEQSLTAGELHLLLAPAQKNKRPTSAGAASGSSARPTQDDSQDPTTAEPRGEMAAVELESLTALRDVRVVSADGGVATGAELYLVMQEGTPRARLTGAPDAVVADSKGNTVVGPVVYFDQSRQFARVQGEGSMYILRQDSPDAPPRPATVWWTRGADMDGAHNRVDAYGPVLVTSLDPDGTVNEATGNNLHLDLADKPPAAGATSQPTNASVAVAPSTRPAAGVAGMKMDAMKDKIVTAITLDSNAVVHSHLNDEAGGILREFELKSNVVRYQLNDPRNPEAKGRIIVPGAGTMLVRDHRPLGADAKVGAGPVPSSAPPAAATPVSGKGAPALANAPADANGQDMSKARGAVAFQWAGDLTYEELSRTAVINRDVIIVFRSDDPKELPSRLDADQVVALFEPRPTVVKAPAPHPAAGGAANPATHPATRPAGGMLAQGDAAPLQLKHMTARGNVTVSRSGDTLNAAQLDYFPLTQWMLAVGAPRNPAVFARGQGADTTAAQRIWWNTQTWNVKVEGASSRGGGLGTR